MKNVSAVNLFHEKKRQKLDSKQSYLAVYSASFIPGNLIILQFSLKLRNVSLRILQDTFRADFMYMYEKYEK